MTSKQLISFESRMKTLWEKGKIRCPLHLSGGNETELIYIFNSYIGNKDYVFAGHRSHYHALLHGVSPKDLENEITKKAHSICEGRARSMAFACHDRRFYASAIVSGVCGIAVGAAWALKDMRTCRKSPLESSEKGQWVWCFVGDSVTETGHFYESLIHAEGHKLPITFVIEDNDRATCTPNEVRNPANIPGVFGESVSGRANLMYYNYEPTTVHVGSGKYVQF